MLIAGTFTAFAGNPVTLVSFYSVYNYLPQVTYVENHGVVDGKVIQFLLDETAAIDEKAAVINALTTHNELKRNALTYRQFLARKYGVHFQVLDAGQLLPEEAFCLGYLELMDQQGDPATALPWLEKAATTKPESQTIQVIYQLAQAESLIREKKPCEAWELFNNSALQSGFNSDMAPEIINTIKESFAEYRSDCE